MFRSFFVLLVWLAGVGICHAGVLSDSSEIHAYAGIEVGAKGVKMCVIRERISPTGQHEIVSVVERSTNTEIVSLTQQAIINTAWAVRSFLDTVVQVHHIPKKMVFIVVSSGVKLALDNSDKLEEVRESIRSAVDEPGRVVYFVRPDQEAALMAEGVIPLAERQRAALCDIGGGNTKGGRFEANGTFLSFALPYGTRTLLKQVPATDSVPVLVRRMDSLYKARLKTEYAAAVSPALLNSGTLYFVGGIVWIISAFTYPEKVEAPYVELTLADLKRFRDMAGSDYKALAAPVYNASLPQAGKIEKMLAQARTTYDRKAVIAGANLVYGMAVAASAQTPGMRFVFDRNAELSWIRGVVRMAAQTGGKPDLGHM